MNLLFSLRWAVVFGVTFFAVSATQAQNNYYVRAGATGANNGSDWNNAYSALPATMQRGATYYVADGSYNGRSFTTAASGTTLITIKKATVADHGTSTGWSDAYGDGQAVFTSSLNFGSPYWLFDGQTGGGPGSWKTGFGFKIAVTGASSGAGVFINGNDVTMRHFEIEGNGGDGDGSGGPNDLVWIGGERFRCSYAYLWNAGRTIFFCNRGNTGVIVEYTWTGYHESTPGQHSEIGSIHDDANANPNGDADDWTFRYCVFTHAEGTGGLMVVGRNLQVYGCVFAPLDGNSLGGGNGLIGTWSANSLTSAKIYNNTFINVSSRGIGLLDSNDSGEFKNNVFYNGDVGNDSSGIGRLTHTHNYYVSLGDGLVTEATQLTGSSDPFTDWRNADFSLKNNTTPGVDLGSPWNVDMFGKTRTTWTRGAIEFGAASTGLTASAGINQTITLPNTASLVGSYVNTLGGLVSLGWSKVSGPGTVGFSAPSAATTSATFSSAGTYVLRLTATVLLVSVSDDVTVTVQVAPDTTAPTVSLTAPAAGTVVSNSITLSATASDNVGVAGVRFFVSGSEVFDDTAAPYSYVWDSRGVINGSRQVYAQARDAAGNIRWSGTNTITVANPPAALPDPSIYWDFNEGSGFTATDNQGNNVLTLRNGATLSAVGRFGTGLSLDGVNDRADAPNSASLNGSGSAISVAAWVKLENQSTWQQILANVKETGAFTPPYFAWHLFGGHASATQWTPMFQAVNTSGTSANAGSSVNVNYGEWVHLVGVYDGSNLRIYVNGVDRGSVAHTGTLVDYSQPLYVGAHGLPGEFAKGIIDEVRIYSQALSASQVQALFGHSPTPIVLAPPFGLRVAADF